MSLRDAYREVRLLGGRLRYIADTGEYAVWFRHVGEYFTTDLIDAVNTAHLMAGELSR